MKWPDGDRYKGSFNIDKFHSHRIYEDADCACYECNFKNDKYY